MALKPKIQALIDFANETTEAGDERLGDAVKTLCDGYSGGGSAPSAFPTLSGEMSSKLAALLAYSNGVTGAGDTRMGDAIRTLCEGWGGEKKVTLLPATYIAGSNKSMTNSGNPIGKNTTNTSYAQMAFTNGANVASYAYWGFDTSSIPSNAIILSVSCKVKGLVSNNNQLAEAYCQLCSGTTRKGDTSTPRFTTSASVKTFDGGTWTRQELDDCRVIFFVQRGTSGATMSYYGRFYGAELTITYTV